MRVWAHVAAGALTFLLGACGSSSPPSTEPPPEPPPGGSGSGPYRVEFSTYLGGTADDANQGVFSDNAGNAYIVGGYNGTTFPATLNTCNLDDSILGKFSPTGALVWSRCIGGSAAKDYIHSAVIDAQGNVFVSGVTFSPNFPTTSGAYRTALLGGKDVFVVKLTSTGTVVWSTLLGGSDDDHDRSALALDAARNVYVAGATRSTDFPTTTGAYQRTNRGGNDSYLAKLSPDGRTLLASTYFGGTGDDALMSGVYVHSDGTVYVAGFTSSSDMPTTAGALQRTYGGKTNPDDAGDGFVARFDSTLSRLVFATYIGGSGNDVISENHGATFDTQGRTIFAGRTNSPNLPTTANVYQRTFGGALDEFAGILSADGSSLVALTYLGGPGVEGDSGVAFDSAGNVAITGESTDSGLPLASPLKTAPQAKDAIVSVLTPDLSRLLFSTYYGGSGDDRGRGIAAAGTRIVMAGDSYSIDYQVTNDAYQTSARGQRDLVLTSFMPAGAQAAGDAATSFPAKATAPRAGEMSSTTATAFHSGTLPALTTEDDVRVGVLVLATGLAGPSALAAAPDGRLFVAERMGRVRVLQHGRLLPQPALTLADVCTTGESGLLGLALHPSFESNHLAYVVYTAAGPDGAAMERLVRYREVAGTLAEPAVLLEIPAPSVHSGGRVRFGPDGRLYVTSGDAGVASSAQDLASLSGKILRLADDGTTPADNPFGSPVWSWGHGHAQGLDWHPVTGDLFETERGQGGNDEINVVQRGRNYGWPIVQGGESRTGMEPPLLALPASVSPAGTAFYRSGAFPAFRNDLFIATERAEALLRVRLDPANPRRVLRVERLLESRFGRLRDVVSAPDGSLYVATGNRATGTAAPDDDRILRLIPLDR